MIELIKVDKQIGAILKIVDYKSLFKLTKDNKTIGYGTINKDEKNLIYIFIEENLRGNGYGKILFSKMLEEIKKEGHKDIIVQFKINNIPMLKIVENNGGLNLSTEEGIFKYLIPI